MKTLTILRHAKSGWDVQVERDFDRPINKRGARGAELIGQCAATEDFRIGTQAFVDKTKPVFVGH